MGRPGRVTRPCARPCELVLHPRRVTRPCAQPCDPGRAPQAPRCTHAGRPAARHPGLGDAAGVLLALECHKERFEVPVAETL